MKAVLRLLLMLPLAASCGEERAAPPAAVKPVPERPVYQVGEIVAHHDERILEDTLNDLRFTVDIVADSLSNERGFFRLQAAYGGTKSQRRFELPANVVARPALRRDSSGYQVSAGFVTLRDSQYHELYRVTGSDSQLVTQRTKRYMTR